MPKPHTKRQGHTDADPQHTPPGLSETPPSGLPIAPLQPTTAAELALAQTPRTPVPRSFGPPIRGTPSHARNQNRRQHHYSNTHNYAAGPCCSPPAAATPCFCCCPLACIPLMAAIAEATQSSWPRAHDRKHASCKDSSSVGWDGKKASAAYGCSRREARPAEPTKRKQHLNRRCSSPCMRMRCIECTVHRVLSVCAVGRAQR